MPDKNTFVDVIKNGYTFKGESYTLGAAVLNGEVLKDALVKLPLKTMNRHGIDSRGNRYREN